MIDVADNHPIVDTKNLQWFSVIAFMWNKYDASYHCGCFIVTEPHKWERTVFSVNSAIELHNDLRIKCDKRLVAKAKLQWNKKKKSLICQSNIVKMVGGNKLEDWVGMGAGVDVQAI